MTVTTVQLTLPEYFEQMRTSPLGAFARELADIDFESADIARQVMEFNVSYRTAYLAYAADAAERRDSYVCSVCGQLVKQSVPDTGWVLTEEGVNPHDPDYCCRRVCPLCQDAYLARVRGQKSYGWSVSRLWFVGPAVRRLDGAFEYARYGALHVIHVAHPRLNSTPPLATICPSAAHQLGLPVLLWVELVDGVIQLAQ